MPRIPALTHLFILAICVVAFGSCRPEPTAEPSGSEPAVLVYRIAGEDARGVYEGSVTLFIAGADSGSVRGMRSVRYSGGPEQRAAATGTLVDHALQLRLENVSAPVADTAALPMSLYGAERAVPPRSYASGRFDRELRSGRVVHRSFFDGEVVRTQERWTLESRDSPWIERTLSVRPQADGWTAVPLSFEAGAIIAIRAPGSSAAQGFFRRQDAPQPQVEAQEQDCVGCGARSYPDTVFGTPTVITADEGPLWIREFDQREREAEWVFWFRDSGEPEPTELELVMRSYDPGWYQQVFCNPWVTIDANPEVVAPGEPVTIYVKALAFAGLDMFWWFGATGLPELDVAHVRAGNGATSGEAYWTVTLDAPGTYRFGANARDVLYWSGPGFPHQASESCGLAWDEVTVQADLRKSYTVGFILLAPEGTDVGSDEFQGYLDRVEGLKTALSSQFATSTDGMGAVDVSYETMVLMPPGPVLGLEDGFAMWGFIGSTLRDIFYASYPDLFDFLAIYEIYPDKAIGSRHQTVKTYVAGFGIDPHDATTAWGSPGRLRGLGLVADVTELPDTYDFIDSKMHLLLHEVFGHQWGVFAEQLEEGGFHFDPGIESPTFSVLYGRPWRKIDDTHFTTEDVQDPATGTFKVTFHPWMLYVAGMKTRDEVPFTLFDVEPDAPPAHRYDLVTTTGTFVNFTLDDVIAESGDRYDVIW